jgi:hypothetical protein
MINETKSSLANADIETLRRVVTIMIPADPAHGVPAASDPIIFADILSSLGRDLDDVRDALGLLAGRLDGSAAEAAISTFLAAPGPMATALSRVVLQCYYRDDRVLSSLGRSAAPPFPKGHIVSQGDWSLLDAVRSRPQFWRDDREV